MTFEEVKSKIDSGGVVSLDEVAEMLDTLVSTQKSSGVYVALALYESRRLYKGARWSNWAAGQYRLADDKDALHRANVGEMLRVVEQRSPKLYGRFMESGISLLMSWAKLFNCGKKLMEAGTIDNPCIPIANFFKANPGALTWKREKLDKEIQFFLNPDKMTEQPELNLTFDAIGAALEDDDLCKLTSREDFNWEQAFIMANNGAKLCTHAVDAILHDHDSLPVAALEDIDRRLEDSHRKLRAMLIRKRGMEA